MSEIVERVARAMCVARGINPDRRGTEIKRMTFGAEATMETELGPLEWQKKVREARAAIEALREPTEADGGRSSG